MPRFWYAVGIIVVVGGLVVLVIFWPLKATAPLGTVFQPESSVTVSSGNDTDSAGTTQQPIVSTPAVSPPIDDFSSRITKKPFGIFITPDNSPVDPERFSGYHTGVDIEYGDTTADIPVRAIAAGSVLESRTAAGYGGVVVIVHEIAGSPHAVIYGHLDPNSLPAVGTAVQPGEQLGILGEGFTAETDGERKHLHFAIRADATVSLLGYTQQESGLSAWIDPVLFFQ